MDPKPDDEYLKYETKDGIFKELVLRASYKPTTKASNFSIPEEEFSKANIFKLSLGNTANPDDDKIYRYCIDNGYIEFSRWLWNSS